MKPEPATLLAIFFIGLFAIYLIFCIVRMRAAPKAQAEMKEIGDANTQAVRENSELLRELIAINRQVLDKQNRDSS